MSPEQCRGEVLDGRSDLYSLGATLYAALSGIPPFKARNTASLLHKVLNEQPPSLAARVPYLPEPVVALVKRLMAKHPGARHQSGKEVVEAIQAIEAMDVREGAAPRRALRVAVPEETGFRPLRWAAVCALGVILGVGFHFLSPQASPEAGAQSRFEPARDTRGTKGLNVFFRTSIPESSSPGDSEGAGRGASEDEEPGEAEGGRGVAFLVPRGTDLDKELKARVEGFRDALLAEDSERILGYFPADIRDSTTLHASLLGSWRRSARWSPHRFSTWPRERERMRPASRWSYGARTRSSRSGCRSSGSGPRVGGTSAPRSSRHQRRSDGRSAPRSWPSSE